MPYRRNAIKAQRKNKKRLFHNLDIKTDIRKTIKKFQAFIANKNKVEAQSTLQVLFKKLDKAAKDNLLHKNTASRRKSRFSRLFKSLA